MKTFATTPPLELLLLLTAANCYWNDLLPVGLTSSATMWNKAPIYFCFLLELTTSRTRTTLAHDEVRLRWPASARKRLTTNEEQNKQTKLDER